MFIFTLVWPNWVALAISHQIPQSYPMNDDDDNDNGNQNDFISVKFICRKLFSFENFVCVSNVLSRSCCRPLHYIHIGYAMVELWILDVSKWGTILLCMDKYRRANKYKMQKRANKKTKKNNNKNHQPKNDGIKTTN